jgi:Mn-dependent DtxR family transcriptional regulator
MLAPVDVEILEVLNDENTKMRAGEISALIDVTYQLVGKRTSKLQQQGWVDKTEAEGAVKSSITDKAKSVYFDTE